MGSVARVLSGGLLGGKKKSNDAPRASVKQDAPRGDKNRDTASTPAPDRSASRRKRVLAQTQVGGNPGGRAGLRTSLKSTPTRSGIGIQ